MDAEGASLESKNPFVAILKAIFKEKAKLDEDLMKENNAILQDFLDTFILEMKEQDKLFASLYQRNYYTGSYYSNLRVAVPDEYDINIVLKLPFKLQEFSVEYHPQVASYVKYKVTEGTDIPRENGLHKLFEKDNLIPDKVRAWMQSVVARAINRYSHPKFKVRSRVAGPATTIILVKGESKIDIDLVPVVQCKIDNKPPGINGQVYSKVASKLQFFMVPKLYQPTKKPPPVNDEERSRLWRAHYPDAEEEIIHDIGCAKPVIKLLKLLRDKYNWKILASYYLKTVVMWMLIENASAEYWKEDKLGDRFLDALGELADYVKQRKLPYVFNSRYNLLEKLSEAEAKIINDTLCGIIKNIKTDRDTDRDYENLWKTFNCDRTF